MSPSPLGCIKQQLFTHRSEHPNPGIIGVGIGLCAAKLAVLAAGALFGLALTMGLLSIPRYYPPHHPHMKTPQLDLGNLTCINTSPPKA